MKRRQKSSASASALQITLSAALLSILTILFASSFRAAAPASPNAPSARVTEGEKGSANAGQAFRPGVFATDALLTFSNTGSLNTARSVHTETLLANGKVLVTGGNNGIDGFLASAELYDPANGSWGATGSLSTARHAHTATLLPNGKVLVVAGLGNSGFLGSAQLYDPASGNWSSTGGLAIGRYNHTATLLPNGKVLVAGGAANSGDLGSAQLYDVTSGTWSATGSFSIPRHAHTATSLPNGKVLIAGGEDVNGRFSSAQLYDPTSGTWSTTGSLTTARSYHTATLLANGKVLVAGGIDVATGELYDPVTGSWSSTGSLNGNRGQHKATLLPNGTVLVTGGLGVSFLNSTELYDPASGNWSAAGNLNAARLQHTATLLPDGRVLVAGGFDDGPDNGGSLVSAELYGSVGPTPTPTGTPTVTPIPVSPTPTPTPTAGPATPTPALSPSPAPDTIYFFYQNFDSMAPPGLPSNWQTSFVNGAADCTPAGTCAFGTNWVTTKSNPYTGPICVFHDAPACVTDSNLDTQSFFVPNVSNLQNVSITFQHNFDLENGRDGGVLEISYDGGCFSDIVGAGGTANYNGTISTGFLSPIAERNAWTGNSGGYVSGIATLPSAAKGHSVRLRFRLATDCSGSGTGWRIDVLDVHARLVPPGTPAPSPSPSPFQTPLPGICSFSEAFDNVPALPNTGWAKKNNSSPLGLTDWGFGDPARFPAQAGATSSYLAVNSYTGCAGATISNWEMTPPVRLQNGGAFTFWTRTAHAPTRPDRLQVRMSTNDNSSNVGTTATSVGDFTTLLLDINPTYTTSGYPSVWTQYTIVLNGLGSPVTGRLAFRYFVENGGPNGPNSDYIGIDTVSYNCNPPTPTPSPTPTASPSPTPTPVPPTPTPAVTPSPAPDTVYFLNENFDRTIPPALPSGWSTSFVNGAADCTPTGTCAFGTNWVTTKNNPYAGPISVFHDAPACVTDSYLNTRSFFVPNSSNIPTIPVSFVHSFNLESGRDGGVLEISYDGGCFVDIVAAGGSANYNGTISTAFQSPIAGRNAWTGNSGGYVNASGTLPSSVKGHSVTLRFRLATDCSGSGSGWSIDAINIQVHVSGSGTPVPSPTPSPSPITTPTVPPSVCSFSEAFNNVGTLPASGWALKNNSSPLGITNWSTGDAARFSAQSGAASSYIAAGSAVGCATLSTWLLTPHITLQNGGAFTFWTRTVNSPIHPDRLQVLMSTNGNSSNVGTTATSVGDFTTLLLDINPTYTTSGYPNAWTQYTVTLSGLGSPVTGRLAFRYFVENGGPYGTNSDYIGIDTVSYNCNPPTPTPSPSPTPTPTPTPSPTPTPTATPISISGTISYCSAPVPGPVPNVTLALTGTMSGSTLSDGSGNYQLSAASGGSYTVTPTKSARTPASDGITTVDVIATQRHFLTLGTPLSGCRLTAADVNGDASVTTIDVIAIQRFYLGLSTGTANVGVYRFNPANRTYPGVISNQSGENYDTLIFGDVASPFVE